MNIALTEARLQGYRDAIDAEQGRGPFALVAVLSHDMPGQFGLGIAVANERGYNPIPAGWACFEQMDQAQAESDWLNEVLGMDADTVARIVASTMGGQHYQSGEAVE
jgi:hypothetical protein